jgi:hypothetical protein
MISDPAWAASGPPGGQTPRLKGSGAQADDSRVRYQRLILEAGANAVTVRFHPRLTVIAGVGRAERDLLVTEILGSLAGGRGGAHMELVDDYGRRMALIRPANGSPDRVLEVDTGEEITGEFAGPDGRPDLLARMGLDVAGARRLCRLTAAEMAVESQGDTLLTVLASADQRQLWAAAECLVAADNDLKWESEQAGADPEDAPIIEEIERRHAAFESAERRHESIRHNGIFVGGASAVGAIPAALLDRWTALPFLGVATLTTLVSIIFRRRMHKAAAAQNEALARAGAQSYIGFQLQRVDRMLDGQKNLTRLADASEAYRRALEFWRGIAGDIAVEWAIEQRDAITELASRLQASRTGKGEWSMADGLPDIDPAELAHWLAARFTSLRRVGPVGESMPLILDDPLLGVDAGVKQWILELIGRSAGSPQVVYLTADPEVAAWARLEAMAGHLAVLEPAPDNDEHATPSVAELTNQAAR